MSAFTNIHTILSGEVTSGSGDLLVVSNYDDARADSSVESAGELLILASGECFPHALAREALNFAQEFVGAGDGKIQELLDNAPNLLDLAAEYESGLDLTEATDSVLALIAQIQLNYFRTIEMICRIACDYVDIPACYGRPKVVELRICRALGGVYDYSDYIHAAHQQREPGKLPRIRPTKFFDPAVPTPRPIPYFTCRKANDVSSQSIANLLGTSNDWISQSLDNSLQELGKKMIEAGCEPEEVIEIFRS